MSPAGLWRKASELPNEQPPKGKAMLKALVRVIAHIEGKRVEFQPGEEVKGLHPHDVKNLIASKSIEDTEATAKAEKAAAAKETAAAKEFEQAKQSVQAAQESIAAEPAAKKAGGKK